MRILCYTMVLMWCEFFSRRSPRVGAPQIPKGSWNVHYTYTPLLLFLFYLFAYIIKNKHNIDWAEFTLFFAEKKWREEIHCWQCCWWLRCSRALIYFITQKSELRTAKKYDAIQTNLLITCFAGNVCKESAYTRTQTIWFKGEVSKKM